VVEFNETHQFRAFYGGFSPTMLRIVPVDHDYGFPDSL
jgi:hypothetical protein